jgi:predicted ATPase/class 3 adenylate cyclase
MAAALPSGTVTFLFTDIEGSTRLLQRLGHDYARVLGEHQALLRIAWSTHGGAEIDTAGDGFFVAFASAPEAVAAAADATRALAEHAWPEDVPLQVRIGLHTGTPQLVGDHYVGLDVHRAARIAAAGHGGQVLLSQTTRDLTKHALPEGVTLRDVGAHRLKDLQESEPLYQLVLPGLPANFPSLKTLDTFQHNLPLQPTPLLGREEQVAAVCSLLRRNLVRLVTLTGPGGIGKTRLSIQVAAELVEDFADGVWSVRLSRLVDPDLVLPTVSQTLGLKDQGRQPIAETLREYLRSRQLLLVLDNFEQVVAAAPEVGALLEASAGLKVLATSRIPLRLRGERVYAVPSLPLAALGETYTPEQLTQYAAVALFIERARDARSNFVMTSANAPAIAEVCARLDGLPLAIELAAARVRVLPPEALLARLPAQLKLLTGGARDAEERQQTMRATIAWSKALLKPAERVLFRRLAVFVGGCTLEAAEEVCAASDGDEPLGIDVLEGLSALVDHSLVQQREEDGEPRFSMLHVIREFALEQLEASGEAEALHRAHAAYFVAVVKQSNILGPEGPWWLAELERDHDNVRAALAWARERGEAEIGLQLAAGVALYWVFTRRLREGARWLEEMLALEDAHAARAASSGGTRSREVLLARAGALSYLGTQVGDAGNLEQSDALFREVEEISRSTGEMGSLGIAYNFLAMHALARGDVAHGQALVEEALAVARQWGPVYPMIVISQNFVLPLLAAGNIERAATLAEESLNLARRSGSPVLEVVAHTSLAAVAVHRGDGARAQELVLEAVRLGRRSGIALSIWYWDCVYALAIASVLQGEHEHAARLAGATAAEDERRGYVHTPPESALWSQSLAPARAALGEEQWAAAFAAGQALSPEEAIAEALGDID